MNTPNEQRDDAEDTDGFGVIMDSFSAPTPFAKLAVPADFEPNMPPPAGGSDRTNTAARAAGLHFFEL